MRSWMGFKVNQMYKSSSPGSINLQITTYLQFRVVFNGLEDNVKVLLGKETGRHKLIAIKLVTCAHFGYRYVC